MAEIGSMLSGKFLPPTLSNQKPALSKPKDLGLEAGGATSSDSFMDTLKGALKSVNEIQKHADASQKDFAVGKSGNISEVLIAMEKADLALRTVTSVRNKMVEAYQEIMRMQV